MHKSSKKIRLFPVLLLTLMSFCLLASCGDSDDKEQPTPTESIVGTWRLDCGEGYAIDHFLMRVEKDGTFSQTGIKDGVPVTSWFSYGTFTVESDTLTLTYTVEELVPHIEPYLILVQTAKTLTLRYEGDNIGPDPLHPLPGNLIYLDSG